MNEIEIKDIQNVAQNMIVGSKQHSLFDCVRSNNPNLVTGGGECVPECGEINSAGECGLEISISQGNDKKFTAVAVSGGADENKLSPEQYQRGTDALANCAGGADGVSAPKGLNSALYGMLKPCNKQFGNSNGEGNSNESD